jgi:hypothetical protein
MSDYTDDGNRGDDPRHGFGDDMGTRVGRPDGARRAPRDASSGQRAGPSTNTEPAADDLEGSILDEGPGQRRVREANENVNPDPADDEPRIDDL